MAYNMLAAEIFLHYGSVLLFSPSHNLTAFLYIRALSYSYFVCACLKFVYRFLVACFEFLPFILRMLYTQTFELSRPKKQNSRVCDGKVDYVTDLQIRVGHRLLVSKFSCLIARMKPTETANLNNYHHHQISVNIYRNIRC